MCDICYMEWERRDCISLKCQHYFCKECIKGYLTFNITNGHVLNLKCPFQDPK